MSLTNFQAVVLFCGDILPYDWSGRPPSFLASDIPIFTPIYPYSWENIGGFKTLVMVIF